MYFAFRSGVYSPLGHRELIDLAMAVVEHGVVSEVRDVSKTKVRGVIALMKHAGIIQLQSVEQEPARLSLPADLTSFRGLRAMHDAFLLQYATEHHVFLPTLLKGEVVWQCSEEAAQERARLMEMLHSMVQSFYERHAGVCRQEKRTGEWPHRAADAAQEQQQQRSGPAWLAESDWSVSEGGGWDMLAPSAVSGIFGQYSLPGSACVPRILSLQGQGARSRMVVDGGPVPDDASIDHSSSAQPLIVESFASVSPNVGVYGVLEDEKTQHVIGSQQDIPLISEKRSNRTGIEGRGLDSAPDSSNAMSIFTQWAEGLQSEATVDDIIEGE